MEQTLKALLKSKMLDGILQVLLFCTRYKQNVLAEKVVTTLGSCIDNEPTTSLSKNKLLSLKPLH